MSKIGIVGCGWLGTPLAISLIKKGHSILGTTTSKAKKKNLLQLGIQVDHWELTHEVSLFSCIFLKNIDILILNIPPNKIKSELSYSSLLQKFGRCLSDKTNVIFVSTTSVYPETVKEVDEKYEWTDIDLQKETVQAEIKLKEIFGPRLTILRLAGLIGNDRHPVKQLSGKTEIPNGNSLVNLIHVEDVIGLIEKIIEKKYWGEIVNGCFPDHPMKKKYYTKVAKYYCIPAPKFKNECLTEKPISSDKSIEKLGYYYLYPISSFK